MIMQLIYGKAYHINDKIIEHSYYKKNVYDCISSRGLAKYELFCRLPVTSNIQHKHNHKASRKLTLVSQWTGQTSETSN